MQTEETGGDADVSLDPQTELRRPAEPGGDEPQEKRTRVEPKSTPKRAGESQSPPSSPSRRQRVASHRGEGSVPADDHEASMQGLLCELREEYFESVLEVGQEQPVCEATDHFDESEFNEYTLAWDDVTGKNLEPEKVQEARAEEIAICNRYKVWEFVPREAWMKPITTRWVDINKGDEEDPNYRSRLVARELNKGKTMWTTFFAAMPPLSALKALMVIAMANSWIDCKGKFIQPAYVQLILIVDVKRAHFRSPATRELHVILPEEAGCPEGYIARLLQSMYGTTDAAQNWEFEYTRVYVEVLLSLIHI